MLSQTIAVTGINVKSIPERWAPSLVIVIGLAGVVAVFTALLAMATGFESTLRSTGRADVGVVMRGGSETELNSGVDREAPDLIKQAKGVRIGANGRPVASGEMTIIAELLRAGSLKDASNITLRGVDPEAFALRPQLKIVEGRNFTPGLRELIVGRGVTRQFAGAGLGKAVRLRGTGARGAGKGVRSGGVGWAVVGIFESGDANESELWTDINVARTTFGRTGSNSVRVALDGPDGFDKVKA